MTIDELNEFMSDNGFCNTRNNEDLPKIYVADLVESAIKEGYNKAIDEFFNELCKASESVRPVGWTQRYCVVTIDKAMEIVEQLKAGVKNDN